METLNEKERQKKEVLLEVIEGALTKEEASLKLDLSLKQIRRCLKRFQEEGEAGLIHKNRGKQSLNQISEDIKKEIITLYLTEYFDYNFSHFYDEIKDRIPVSYISICRVLEEAEILSPEAHHKTTKLYNSRLKKAIREGEKTEEEIKFYEQRQEWEKQKHIRKSTLLYHFGQEVQMDAAFAPWFGEKESALHLVVDKAT